MRLSYLGHFCLDLLYIAFCYVPRHSKKPKNKPVGVRNISISCFHKQTKPKIIGDCHKISTVWDNLWKSRGGSQVNLCPRAVPRVINLPLGVD